MYVPRVALIVFTQIFYIMPVVLQTIELPLTERIYLPLFPGTISVLRKGVAEKIRRVPLGLDIYLLFQSEDPLINSLIIL